MIFEKAEDVMTVIEQNEIERKPNYLFEHFMNYGDEVFYVLNQGKIYGIITPGDLYRCYQKKNRIPEANRDFAYLTDQEDEKRAEIIFQRYPSIHEIAVVKNGCFCGIVKNGYRKSWKEWVNIRKGLCESIWEIEHIDWIKRDIQKLLERENKIFIYRYPSMEDMKLSKEERKVQEEKNLLVNEGLTGLTQREQFLFLGEDCDSQYVSRLSTSFNYQIIYKNGLPRLLDKTDVICTVRNGHRIIPNVPQKAFRRILMFGPCTIFGDYVKDEHTVGAYLQEMVSTNGFSDWEVVNCSLGGLDWDRGIERIFAEETSKDDIIIFMSRDFEQWKMFEERYPEKLHCMESMRDIWERIDNPIDHIFNAASHCDSVVNKKISEKMFCDIQELLKEKSTEVNALPRSLLQPFYISWDVALYYKRFLKQYVPWEFMHKGDKIGAIVLTGNPFTRGHRYLIEQAYKEVDFLYIFVVEEDQFTFSFTDRLEMAKRGTSDLKNISVIPSGKYIISKSTFGQYFQKEQVKIVENMEYDIHIFGEVVAKELRISYRFIGEEPFDKVTANYNNTMKSILPGYGVEVIEIPRLKQSDGTIISASYVRNRIKENKLEGESMLTVSTLEYLKETYGYKNSSLIL